MQIGMLWFSLPFLLYFCAAITWGPQNLVKKSDSHGIQERMEYRIDSSTLVRSEPFTTFVERKPEVPAIQRERNDDRVEEFLKAMVENYYSLGRNEVPFMGPLSMAQLRREDENDNDVLFLVDGQHRYEAYKQFYATYKVDFYLCYFVKFCASKDELYSFFRQINNHYKMDEIVIQSFFMKPREALVKYLRGKYPEHLSTSSEPRFPNISLDKFLTVLFNRYPNDSANAIIEKLEQWNQYVGKELAQADFPSYEKAFKKQSFFLGHVMKGKPASGAKSLPKAVRVSVWEERFGDRDSRGECYCCLKAIAFDEFHLGHKKSR